MLIKRIKTITLNHVKLELSLKSKCFLHDLEFLGTDQQEFEKDLEGQQMLIYTGDFTKNNTLRCIWCDEPIFTDLDLFEQHIYEAHKKISIDIQLIKFQKELYKEKLHLMRAGEIDHTYFIYMVKDCQMCSNQRARGRGLCAIPESARNKTRSINAIGLEADGFSNGFKLIPNIGYIIGKQM